LPPEDEMDFVLDRPFMFVIKYGIGTPLFIGIVENP
jgi:serine protease inhibitor